MPWLDLPAIGLYIFHSVIILAYLWWLRDKRYAFWVFILMLVAALAWYLHVRVVFVQYSSSESQKILVVFIYHPLITSALLKLTRITTRKLIDLSPGADAAAAHWYTIYAGFYLALQVTGR